MTKRNITFWIKTVLVIIFLFIVGSLKSIGAEQESFHIGIYIDSLQLEIATNYKTVASISLDENNCFDNIGWTITMSGLTNISGYLQQLKILHNAHYTLDSINRGFVNQELNIIQDNISVDMLQIIENMLPKIKSGEFLYDDIMDKVIMPLLTYIAIERYKASNPQKEILCLGMYKIIERIKLESERLKLSLNNTENEELTKEGKRIMDIIKTIILNLQGSMSKKCSESDR